ncbi:hypothetical protein TNCV_1933621 [Trichonephila clavipes]|nr:hypothetical protein TNCV_1933621 [Trichonephila clavipes]
MIWTVDRRIAKMTIKILSINQPCADKRGGWFQCHEKFIAESFTLGLVLVDAKKVHNLHSHVSLLDLVGKNLPISAPKNPRGKLIESAMSPSQGQQLVTKIQKDFSSTIVDPKVSMKTTFGINDLSQPEKKVPRRRHLRCHLPLQLPHHTHGRNLEFEFMTNCPHDNMSLTSLP